MWAHHVCARLILLRRSGIVALIFWRHQQSQVQKSHPLGNDQTPTWHSHSMRGELLGIFPLKKGLDLHFWGRRKLAPVVLELVPNHFFGVGPEEELELTCGV